MITHPATQSRKLRQLSFPLFLLSCIILLSNCNKPLEIKDFDKASWKADRMACNNTRAKQENVIMIAKNELLRLSQEEIIELLGKPEKQELYTRGQKFYIYYLSPSPACQGAHEAINTRFLYIRFSAINMVNEIFVQHK